ncbi:GL11394 [Drosophila persimilis]|uniref:GL11394 n=1 Tax=Drosophila persimilis TaxID=7234 RepID=B4GAJ6_DROPE|nr:GL11394 [Drosophila persimilis]
MAVIIPDASENIEPQTDVASSASVPMMTMMSPAAEEIIVAEIEPPLRLPLPLRRSERIKSAQKKKQRKLKTHPMILRSHLARQNKVKNIAARKIRKSGVKKTQITKKKTTHHIYVQIRGKLFKL